MDESAIAEVLDGGGACKAALKAPFPWFGGKSRAAGLIWQRFGDVANYVEPFAGSLAVLLARPGGAGKIETVNDLDCYLANFWRALQADPAGVALRALVPVNEADLHARHRWLVDQHAFRERMRSDPDYWDVKIAGWWVWGLCAWIGSGWCVGKAYKKLPDLGNGGRGVHRLSQQLPALSNAGRGVHRLSQQLPHLGGTGADQGRGLHSQRFAEGGVGLLHAIAARLRRVRVACGDWRRVCSPAVTWRHGMTAILLDPPYADGGRVYGEDYSAVSAEVRHWALQNGDNPKLRIALCGYEGEHGMPAGWTEVAWKARGGYGSARKLGVNVNAYRERVWFSPACLVPG